MNPKLFNIEEYKRISYPEVTPLETPYFCVGCYLGRGWANGRWKIFSETMSMSSDNPYILNFIQEKENSGWIMYICKLPDFKQETETK